MKALQDFGWTTERQKQWDDLRLLDMQPARVVADFGTSLKIAMDKNILAELSGKLAHFTDRDDIPKVGDWVAVRVSENGNVTIDSVVMRSNEIARKRAGKQVSKQIIAVNIDIAFVLLALDEDFSVERLKRFLYQLSASKISTVLVLNKSDKTNNIDKYLVQLQQINLPIVISSAINEVGVDQISAFIAPGSTAILLGSSGVGKSTLTNKLLGKNVQTTNSVRDSDSAGRHTTVHRELFILPGGGILIDTPGIRELQLWGDEDVLYDNFDDIRKLIAMCKYSNCQHAGEQNCAVMQAIANNILDKKHYADFVKMKAELTSLSIKNIEQRRRSNKKQPKFISKSKLIKRYNTRRD